MPTAQYSPLLQPKYCDGSHDDANDQETSANMNIHEKWILTLTPNSLPNAKVPDTASLSR